MSILIVILPPGPAGPTTAFEHVLSADRQHVTSHSRCAAALLPAAGTGGEVVALVPAARLSWHQVTLPKNTLDKRLLGEAAVPRLRAVLEGLLEERLLDETAQLHFALAPQARADAPLWVAVCERDWLRGMLQTLEAAGRPVTRIVPEFTPEAQPPCLYVMGEDAESAQMVASGRDGVTQGITRLPLSGTALALLAWPADGAVQAEPAVAALAEQLLQRPVAVQQAAQRWLQSAQTPWDLAQLDFIATGQTRFWKKANALVQDLWRAPRWRAARWAVCLLLGANLLGLNAWAWQQQASLKAKQAAVSQVLTQAFPQVKVVVDAPLQMAREVARLRQATGAVSGQDLESMLGAVGAAVPPGQAATAVEYISGEARVRGLPVSGGDGMALVSKLQQRGMSAQVEADGLVLKPGGAP